MVMLRSVILLIQIHEKVWDKVNVAARRYQSMGFLKRLVSGGPSKTDLIRDLVKRRISLDPLAGSSGVSPETVDSLSKFQLSSLPEAGIVTNVETYLKMKKIGATDEEIFDRIETHRSRMVSGSMPGNCDLRGYIKYRAHLENMSGASVSDESIDYAIDEAVRFFSS